jgi:hypothetical protein
MSNRETKGPNMTALLARLGDYVKEHDPATDPKYAQAAGLLAEAATEAQRHGQALTHLTERTDQLLHPTSPTPVARHFDTQVEWCEDILKRSDGPRRYSDIADQMYDEGYQHTVTVKNPTRQLKDSIWVAMNEDERFAKVGRGVFDLASRKPAS